METSAKTNPLLTKPLDARASRPKWTSSYERLSDSDAWAAGGCARHFHNREEHPEATNRNKTDGHLEGAVKGRSQFKTPSGHPAKRDTKTGRILNVKADKTPFKGVRKEK